MRLSVIIPTLNEADYLGRTVDIVRRRSRRGKRIEIVVADCGSADATLAVAREGAVRVVQDPTLTNRARACNAGAACAGGDVFLFLHADSHVPERFEQLIFDALAEAGVVGGAFEFKLDGPQWRLRLVEWINRVRYRIRGRFYGDQGIFVLRDVFESVGGFCDVPILEDAWFCRDARTRGRMRLITVPMRTSPRRFCKGGILTVLALDVLIWLWDAVHLNPAVFATVYRANNTRRADSQMRDGDSVPDRSGSNAGSPT